MPRIINYNKWPREYRLVIAVPASQQDPKDTIFEILTGELCVNVTQRARSELKVAKRSTPSLKTSEFKIEVSDRECLDGLRERIKTSPLVCRNVRINYKHINLKVA
jgi:hypothetical protein